MSATWMCLSASWKHPPTPDPLAPRQVNQHKQRYSDHTIQFGDQIIDIFNAYR